MGNRDDILSEIRRTAAENGGKPLGKRRFATETGIRESDWEGRFWARWGDALREAGFEPNTLQGAFDDDRLINHLIDEIRQLGRFPTSRELTLRRRQGDGFPSTSVFERLGSKKVAAAKVAAYCGAHAGYEDVPPLLAPLLASEENADARNEKRATAPVGFV